jgi:hypothetical protein
MSREMVIVCVRNQGPFLRSLRIHPKIHLWEINSSIFRLHHPVRPFFLTRSFHLSPQLNPNLPPTQCSPFHFRTKTERGLLPLPGKKVYADGTVSCFLASKIGFFKKLYYIVHQRFACVSMPLTLDIFDPP